MRDDQLRPIVDFGVKLIGKSIKSSFVGAILAEAEDQGGQITQKGENRIPSGGIKDHRVMFK